MKHSNARAMWQACAQLKGLVPELKVLSLQPNIVTAIVVEQFPAMFWNDVTGPEYPATKIFLVIKLLLTD